MPDNLHAGDNLSGCIQQRRGGYFGVYDTLVRFHSPLLGMDLAVLEGQGDLTAIADIVSALVRPETVCCSLCLLSSSISIPLSIKKALWLSNIHLQSASNYNQA
jgi:hypothetical protein